MLYEGVLLFGVVMLAGLLFAGLMQQRHALQGQWGLRVFLFLVLGAYFVGFWTRRGQTLPMKTWHVELRAADGGRVPLGRAVLRYLLSWLWFLPALGIAWASQLKGGWAITGVLTAGVLAYAALARLHPSRQYFHDLLCGTRLVDVRPASPGRADGVGQNRPT
jgi:uncharacterized RDD family membrane protein YckC